MAWSKEDITRKDYGSPYLRSDWDHKEDGPIDTGEEDDWDLYESCWYTEHDYFIHLNKLLRARLQ
jgi:hypothetical protein